MMDADAFDKEVQTLGMLAKNEQTMDAFTELYERLLTAVVSMRLTDLRGIADGTYRARLTMLQALSREHMAWARAQWPAECETAEQEVKRGRDRRHRRERAAWN
jgi:hypothetical protein